MFYIFIIVYIIHIFNLLYCRYVPGQYFIAADKAYPVFDWCIPPYIDRGSLSDQEKFFNVALSRARQSIGRCFALLKSIYLFLFNTQNYINMV